MPRYCKKCRVENQDNDTEHHIIPKALGGTDKDGRDVLCIPHHNEFHKRHYGIMMGLLVELGYKDITVKRTKEYYEWWLKQ